MKKIKVAVLGCGNVGHFHAKAFQEDERSELVGVWNRTYETAEAFGRQYGVPAFRTIEELAKQTGAEAVAICTTHPTHAQVAVEAARCGMHLLVEKPFAISCADADAILQAGKENGVLVATVCQRRFFTACQRVKHAIEEGCIGTPILGTVNMFGWRDQKYYESAAWRGTWDGEGGGVLVNQAPHQIDLLLWYMGPAVEVYGVWGNLNHSYIPVEDTAIAVIRFANGALGNILVTNSVNPALYGKVHVYGDNGAAVGVQTDGGAMFIAGMSSITEPPLNDLWTVPGQEGNLKLWEEEDTAFFHSIDATRYFHKLQVRDFLEAVAGEHPPLIPGIQGRQTVEIFEAIYRSQREHRPIALPLT